MKTLILSLAVLIAGSAYASGSNEAYAIQNLSEQLQRFWNQHGKVEGSGDDCALSYSDSGNFGKFIIITDSQNPAKRMGFAFDGPNERGRSVEQVDSNTWAILSRNPGDCVDPEYNDPRCRSSNSVESIRVSGSAVTITNGRDSLSCVF